MDRQHIQERITLREGVQKEAEKEKEKKEKEETLQKKKRSEAAKKGHHTRAMFYWEEKVAAHWAARKGEEQKVQSTNLPTNQPDRRIEALKEEIASLPALIGESQLPSHPKEQSREGPTEPLKKKGRRLIKKTQETTADDIALAKTIKQSLDPQHQIQRRGPAREIVICEGEAAERPMAQSEEAMDKGK